MITIFTCPKAFDGHVGIIQRNAIQSWLLLDPRPQLILVGSDSGVADLATELGVSHVSDVATNRYGTPIVPSVFERAELVACSDLLAYVNADIILDQDLIDAVGVCKSLKKFLLVGERIEMDVQSALHQSMEAVCALFQEARKHGSRRGPLAIDYFVFRRGLWREIPPFSLGRCAWDNWLLYAAVAHSARLIDATPSVTAVHQNHDYSHARDKTHKGVWGGEEAKENYAMAGSFLYDLRDCDYRLDKGRIRAARDRQHVLARMDRLANKKPRLWRALRSWKVRYAACYFFPRLCRGWLA